MMDKVEFISSLKWYFEVKNLCLEKALAIRGPLLVNDQKELRLLYSQYFSGLASAIELLKDEFGEKFFSKLKDKMVFEKYANGKQNCDYVRELRNSIIHRGEDILAGAHLLNDGFPLIVLPQQVTDRKGEKKYQAFDLYLINLISKCEYIIPKIIHEFLKEEGLLKATKSQEEMEKEHKQFINDSVGIPNWVKHVSQKFIPDFTVIQEALINGLIVELEHNLVDKFRKDFVGDFTIWSPSLKSEEEEQ